MSLNAFLPAVQAWFERDLGAPTEVQARAWPAIGDGGHVLIAAPTGSGKTLAAFLAAIDGLVRHGLEEALPDETVVLYVSPLRALSNDIQRNLQMPLAGIGAALAERGLPEPEIRAWVRTGDTPASDRERMRKRPPHIVVTTPESLYILLTSESGRRMLSSVRSVIVDEIHAVAGTKRGSHLALSLERLAALTDTPPQRIGLSATQKPVEEVAAFLTGGTQCTVIDTGHVRERDLAITVPGSPLSAVMANEVWEEVYDRLAALVDQHRTTLIFANTRRVCERVARHLADRLGETAVTSHHGSLAREHRLQAEQRLKKGELRALVATASLELGIDIGEVDLVCQLGSPRSMAAFLQRVGRSGHGVGRLPKGRLFPLTRDDLLECTALMGAVKAGELDRLHIPEGPLDVLAQQVVAEVAGAGEYDEEALFRRLTSAWPYRSLSRESFDAVLQMLADGYTTRRGRRGAYLHRDRVNARLRPRRAARLVALTNGGAIPDQFDYDVMLQPEDIRVGTVNEDFAFESMPGDVFQLGNQGYRILKVATGRVFVEDAKGAPPSIPFWFGEAPARTEELSQAVSRLRAGVDERLADGGEDAAHEWLETAYGLSSEAAEQLAAYLARARAALGVVPNQAHLVLERFFDEAGDMHLVLHAPFGSRLNRAWGLALRKRFCRKFNFELQAAALEDTIVLSLGPTHSFPLDEVWNYLNSKTVREVLIQALLDAPMFGMRWRWNASIGLAVPRTRNGRRRPPQLQRQDAEDLLSVVFPDQLACAENLAGAREIPDHPLVSQTLRDCLTEAMDVSGLERLLERLERGEVVVSGSDLAVPSPLAEEVVNARPYAFLDDGAQEERRTLSVRTGDTMDVADAAASARYDPEVVRRVRDEAWPQPRDSDELHDALVLSGFISADEGAEWQSWFESLATARRATAVSMTGGETLWVAAERLAELREIHPRATLDPIIEAVGAVPDDADTALIEVLRSRLESVGPTTATALAIPLGVALERVTAALARLESEGFVLQGSFAGATSEVEWCERRLLARMHRYAVDRKRAEIEPVSIQHYLRFLLDWHGLTERPEGVEALASAVERLEGFPVAAGAWEQDVLPGRVADYAPYLLDQLLASGRFVWLRLVSPRVAADDERHRPGPLRNTPIALVERQALGDWRAAAPGPDAEALPLSGGARRVLEALQAGGAMFFADLLGPTRMLRTQVEEALGELAAWGLVTSDTFNGLRALIAPAHKRPPISAGGRRRRRQAPGVDAGGRWSWLPVPEGEETTPPRRITTDLESLEHIAWVLLQRYGVVFRRVLERESALPPWRELLYVYRRLEARGEIRGGRFVQQFAGEQFALPEAVGALKAMRKRELDDTRVVVSAADPLNLLGVLTPGARLPAVSGNRLLYRDGVPEAVLQNGDVHALKPLPTEIQWQVTERLRRGSGYRPQPSETRTSHLA
ncbi:ATP-dependent DNA helicase [Litchfieldella anticariensis FP35 = DSM 16096]|uniref:ATP-dependent DNA helicase n=1 Tax=Litchfieldella anticariensis (strain DSM 16096 / CECT 5854 / CIP 108499 / LMG 22089 / FP35) TaxID=1121939 RepID=S2KLR3_LITA3|nr:DEAD/DEAH box helicase [Halomonas anticariensis]EPC03092.1 ATP-dependent DNA helicase [Halomonas anticariensis FP35 = DSM 16096]